MIVEACLDVTEVALVTQLGHALRGEARQRVGDGGAHIAVNLIHRARRAQLPLRVRNALGGAGTNSDLGFLRI